MTQNIRSLSTYILMNKAFINGKWIDSLENKSFGILNPASQKVIGNVPDLTIEQVNSSILLAHDSFDKWKKISGKERGHILRKWFDLMIKNKEALAALITQENGKTMKESLTEIELGASYIEWFSGEAPRINGDILTSPKREKQLLVFKEPLGVCAFITPWNFPSAMIARKVGPALAAGCTCVLKPSEETPLSALALAKLSQEAGLPPGVFNVLTCSTKSNSDVGKLLCTHPLISKISFTGSTKIGKILLSHCSQGIKKTSMELGGNAPFIIFPSADLKKALSGLIASKFRCSGQTCVCANRILVHADIYDEFARLLKEEVGDMPVGPGNDPATDIGPLINKAAADNIEALLEDSVLKGAKVSAGGKRLGETFFEPTVLQHVTPDMRIYQEEIFGPVASLIKFSTEEEAVEIANSTPFGLASYFYSRDVEQIWRVKSSLHFGMVGINEGIITTAEAPFGGVKYSGFGYEGSKYGIEEYLHKKYVCWSV
ncbi:succinate-semialdehyde dehydrogenase, mitochondrial-like isoform X2 [Gordionus sp. m RMFG-2023]|uniref:succinate-semialdehyde dehydrogenase, mitochondrial-like isoform X2 n=1 Tax=Gordionus sp. m RMFG-2023 TaxID=3053472 RepID=UPI0031FCED0E